jgi:uncharacterized BrkB/YihY/UPF0761 family membrane protein
LNWKSFAANLWKRLNDHDIFGAAKLSYYFLLALFPLLLVLVTALGYFADAGSELRNKLIWLLVSFGFRIYLHFFDSYSVTYGSLGAVIILMLWFYFTGLAILLGGDINSELEHTRGK